MKRESEVRRQSEIPADLTNKPHRVIPVDTIISPFGSGEDKVPREDTPISYWSPECPSMPDLVPKDTATITNQYSKGNSSSITRTFAIKTSLKPYSHRKSRDS